MKFAKFAALFLAVLFVAAAEASAQGPAAGSAAGTGTATATAEDNHPFRFNGIGVGLVIIGAGLGIGRLTASAVESMARQPELAANIQTAMIISAALIEGVSFFAIIVLGFIIPTS